MYEQESSRSLMPAKTIVKGGYGGVHGASLLATTSIATHAP